MTEYTYDLASICEHLRVSHMELGMDEDGQFMTGKCRQCGSGVIAYYGHEWKVLE